MCQFPDFHFMNLKVYHILHIHNLLSGKSDIQANDPSHDI